jgi:hypothetical protein
MEVGLLWYDNDPRRTLDDKVGNAARRYREKFGRLPNTCHVHSAACGRDRVCHLADLHTAVRLVVAPNILPHHFWLGETMVTHSGAKQESGVS